MRVTLEGMLRRLRSNFHPLWRLRRSRCFPWVERIFERTVFRRLDHLPHVVALRRLRDLSWWVGGANLEPDTRHFMSRLLTERSVSVFYDIGANIGFYSWFVRTLQPGVELVLVEPDPMNASLIRLTMQAKEMERVRLIQAALCATEGTVNFIRDGLTGATGHLEEFDASADAMSAQGSYGPQNGETIQVDSRSIDGLICSGTPAPDLMKIDVELAEFSVLQGATQLLRNKKVMVLIEVVDERVFKLLQREGYDVWLIDEPALNYFAAPFGAFSDTDMMAPYQKLAQ
jgi:FkbM family methyltransferase